MPESDKFLYRSSFEVRYFSRDLKNGRRRGLDRPCLDRAYDGLTAMSVPA